jgi:hypothetical protein
MVGGGQPPRRRLLKEKMQVNDLLIPLAFLIIGSFIIFICWYDKVVSENFQEKEKRKILKKIKKDFKIK